MKSHQQIIDETKFRGFHLYKRVRIEAYEVQIAAPPNITEYPGLLVAGQASFTHSQLSSSRPDWVSIAHQIIELTLLDLIINDFIELIAFTDREFFLGKLFRRTYKNYRLAIKDRYSGEDNLAACIIKSIQYTESCMDSKADLEAVIMCLLDEYLGVTTHEFPPKVFVTELLAQYSHKHSWITLTIYQNTTNYPKLNITLEKQHEFKHAYAVVSDISETLRYESDTFYLYSEQLYTILESEFWRRNLNNS